MLNGYKTYLGGGLAILFAVSGYLTGNLEFNEAIPHLSYGLVGIGLAHKIVKAVAAILAVYKEDIEARNHLDVKQK